MKDNPEFEILQKYFLYLKRIVPKNLPFRRSPYLRCCILFALVCLTIIFYPRSEIISDLIVEQRIFHFDLKGAPPRPEYFRDLFPFLKSLGFNTILMEYEDMFPYSGELKIFRTQNAYSPKILSQILKMAEEHNFEVIPLVQTFGHLQFALKHSKFADLRELKNKTDTICPSNPKSISLIQEMLRQIKAVHPNSKRIHIGCDEAWNIAKDERCQKKLESEFGNSVERLKLSHISSIAKFAKNALGFEAVLAWDDLMRKASTALLEEYQIGENIIPIIWNYDLDVSLPHEFPHGMFERYTKIFPKIIFGSVFKGAENGNTTFVEINRYFSNFKSFFQLYERKKELLEGRIAGIAVTGWQRFWHGIDLCELLPEGIPSLATEAVFMSNPALTNLEVEKKVFGILNCRQHSLTPVKFGDVVYVPRKESIYAYCNFPGSDVYALIEKLHFLQWKTKIISSSSLKSDVKILLEEFQRTLSKYFYKDTVEEFIKQNINPIISSKN